MFAISFFPHYIGLVITLYLSATAALPLYELLRPLTARVAALESCFTCAGRLLRRSTQAVLPPEWLPEELEAAPAILSLVATLTYFLHDTPYGVEGTSIAAVTCNNFLCASLGLEATSQIRIRRFPVAAALLAGLFVYDVFWVFGEARVHGFL